jgi:hypothetical protein
MAGNYMRVVPQTYTDADALPASATPVIGAFDAIWCITSGTVVVTTPVAAAVAAQGNTDPNGSTHTIAMVAGQLLPLASVNIVGDGTFVGLALIL